MAAAASDARMSGCELPVIINSGSGNQGITASLPVIEYAKELKVDREKLYRAPQIWGYFYWSIKGRAYNDLTCTTIDRLLPPYDLATIRKQFATYNDGLFDHTRYLPSLMQPLGCIRPKRSLYKDTFFNISIYKETSTPGMILARPLTISWNLIAINKNQLQ